MSSIPPRIAGPPKAFSQETQGGDPGAYPTGTRGAKEPFAQSQRKGGGGCGNSLEPN